MCDGGVFYKLAAPGYTIEEQILVCEGGQSMQYASRIVLWAMLALVLALAACGTPSGSEQPTSDGNGAADTPTSGDIDVNDWDSVVAAANGQTVNWYMWGGSESINNYVDTFYGVALQERYNITLNRVPVADIVETVDQLLSEQAAGVETGTVDLMWINGENFASLKQADMLYGGWARSTPNSDLVDWENPALIYDFGEPIEDLESPWSSAQLQLIYDSARISEDELPRSYAELLEWTQANPGRFTYIAPGPGAFQGTRFVKGALFELSGGAEQWRTYDQELWDEWAPELWDYLNEMQPYLWREGETYPADVNELHGLFANQEVDFSITQAIAGAGPAINQGLIPDTSRAFVFDDYMIGDFNYVAIPANAPHKPAALVLANMLLEPEFQAAQILPENGFGLGFGIDITKVEDPDDLALLEAATEQLGPPAVDPVRLQEALAPDSVAEYQTLIEEEWRANVLIGSQ
jgi:putative spermidine/putrescine transport system substrate-binding protein